MRWCVLFYLTIKLYCVDSKEDIQIDNFIKNDDNSELFSLSKCIEIISEMELSFQPTVIIDIQNIKDFEKGRKFAEAVAILLMHNVPTIVVSKPVYINLNDKSLTIGDTQTSDVYGTVVTCFETCGDIITYDFENINKNMKHLIIILDALRYNCTYKLEQVSSSVDKYDITFMFHDAFTGQNKMYTFLQIIDGYTCETVSELEHINTCFNGSLRNDKIFPSKNPINLNKCPLRVGMTAVFPFSTIENNENLNTYDPIDEPAGSDIKIMKIVAEQFNATLQLYFVEANTKRTGNDDFIKFMINGSLDICSGGMYRMYGDIVAYSGIYARQAIVWIYSVKRDERSWINLMGTFHGFYIFVLFYIIYSIIWYIICWFDGDAMSLTKSLLYGFAALISGNFLLEARSVKQKILNLGYLVMSIYLSAYISVQMFSFLTIRGPPRLYNTHHDIMTSGRVPYLINLLKYFVNEKKYNDFVNRSADCSNYEDCVNKTLRYNGLTIVLQGDFYNFQSTTSVNGEARILRSTENILTVYNEILVRKDSSIASNFNQVVQSLFEAGITERLYHEAIGILLMGKAASANSNMVMNSYSCQSGCTITLIQFAGVFYIWLFGCVLSFIVFIFEICLKRPKMVVN